MTEGPTPPSLARQTARFVVHVAIVYALVKFSTPWLAGWTRNTLLPMVGSPTNSGRFEFLFTHLFTFSAMPAFVLGLASGKFRHRVALFVWIVPTMVLAYKLIVFPTSVLEGNHFAAAARYYFDSPFLGPGVYELERHVQDCYDQQRLPTGSGPARLHSPALRSRGL